MDVDSNAWVDFSQLDRRRLLRQAAGLAAVGLGLGPRLARAATPQDQPVWPTEAFEGKTHADVLKSLYGKVAAASDKITLDAPEIAENGAVVPVSVATTLPNVTSIAILVPENPFTLAAYYSIPAGTVPAVSARLKMGKTSPMVVVVESDGKLFTASKDVKVTLGGCGG